MVPAMEVEGKQIEKLCTFHAYPHIYAFCGGIPSSVPAMETGKKSPKSCVLFLHIFIITLFVKGGIAPSVHHHVDVISLDVTCRVP